MYKVRKQIDDIVLATKGIITTNIISIDELSIILATAKMEHGLEPIFSTNQLASYYSIMYALIAPEALILQLPMSSNYMFNHYRFIPFPTYNHNETLILKTNNTDLLISSDSKYYAETNKKELARCHTIENLQICPSNVLPLFNVLEKPSCLVHMLSQSSMIPECELHVVTPGLKVEVITPYVFLTRASNRKARLTCPDGSSIINHRTLRFREECSYEDTNLLILSRQEHVYTLQRNHHYTIQAFPMFNISEGNWNVVRPVDSMPQWTWTHEYHFRVILPTTTVLISVMIGGLVAFICFKKKRTSQLSTTAALPMDVSKLQHVAEI